MNSVPCLSQDPSYKKLGYIATSKMLFTYTTHTFF